MYEGAVVPILSLIRQSLFLHHVTEQGENLFLKFSLNKSLEMSRSLRSLYEI